MEIPFKNEDILVKNINNSEDFKSKTEIINLSTNTLTSLNDRDLRSLIRRNIISCEDKKTDKVFYKANKDFKKIKKNDLNKNIRLSEGNLQSKETEDVFFLTWSLPSRITCPFACPSCMKRCFAKKNEYFSRVRESRMKNLNETKKDTFVSDMIEHLEFHLNRRKTENKLVIVRIHTSGDFYSLEYLDKWCQIVNHFKGEEGIKFQAYTKSIKFVHEWLKNRISEENINSENMQKELNNLNIRFVYSIWYDTPKEDIALAKELNLQTFTALPKKELEEVKNQKSAFVCGGDCGHCKECYTGKSPKIVIAYH